MIVNFRTTKWFLTRILFALSIIANIYAIMALNATEQSLEGCEDYIKQIETAQAYYITNFGKQEN